MTKRPSFQFYPADWKNDPALKVCSDLARLLWLEILCLMHEGKPYGHLTLPNGTEIDLKMIEKLIVFDPKNVKKIPKLFQELKKNGVIKHSENNGLYYSKKLVQDEEIRRVRAEAGSKGGNPNLVKQKVNQSPNQKPTPSSSSSSSPSVSLEKKHTKKDPGLGVCVDEKFEKWIDSGERVLSESKNPNMCNLGWVRGFLSAQFTQLPKDRPELSGEILLSIWCDVCDQASAEGVSAVNWYKKVFKTKAAKYKPGITVLKTLVPKEMPFHERVLNAKTVRIQEGIHSDWKGDAIVQTSDLSWKVNFFVHNPTGSVITSQQISFTEGGETHGT